MEDYDLLKLVHNELPNDYRNVLTPFLKKYASHLVNGGTEQDERAKQLFCQYWVGYLIYHNQQKKKFFELWDLMEREYQQQRQYALKFYERIMQEDRE